MSRTSRHRILAAMLSACLLSLLGGCTPLTVLAVLGGCKDGGSTGSEEEDDEPDDDGESDESEPDDVESVPVEPLVDTLPLGRI